MSIHNDKIPEVKPKLVNSMNKKQRIRNEKAYIQKLKTSAKKITTASENNPWNL